ncbi:unnamed protein product [Penicillium camemberti]|uniref:Str. FM013 n=1 Tax=Penicillium camemberti (strain FM 013) TaxID=1429867 RepID=A0A0G4P7H5_PENC3|nr:unnamed protein product [Penicillium camemberti]
MQAWMFDRLSSLQMMFGAKVLVAYCVGNIIGSRIFFADEAPSYPGLITCL